MSMTDEETWKFTVGYHKAKRQPSNLKFITSFTDDVKFSMKMYQLISKFIQITQLS